MNMIQGQIKNLSTQLNVAPNDNLKTDSVMSIDNDYNENHEFQPKSLNRRKSSNSPNSYELKPTDMEQRPSFGYEMPKLKISEKHQNYDMYNGNSSQNMKNLPMNMTVGQFEGIKTHALDPHDPSQSARLRSKRDSARYGHTP